MQVNFDMQLVRNLNIVESKVTFMKQRKSLKNLFFQNEILSSNYEEIGELGKGGNGYVYKAKHKQTNNIVAVKILYSSKKARKIRFKREVDSMIRYYNQGLGVLPVFDSCKDELWYTMPIAMPIVDRIKSYKEQFEGQGYREKEVNKNVVLEIVHAVTELCETLIKIHSQKGAHRDIKPSNIYYYDGKYVLGDFGLVYISKTDKQITQNGEKVGPEATIAPEMRYYKEDSNFQKADVYSMAKTLWMLLVDSKDGFYGWYDIRETEIGLHFKNNLKGLYLVEIEDLLVQSTRNDPNERPTMQEFYDKLKEWENNLERNNWQKRLENGWDFIRRTLFGHFQPIVCEWEDLQDVADVLNTIGIIDDLNYLMFPDRGGLVFDKAERTDYGCLYLITQGLYNIVKPKRLVFVGFKDVSWNYFLLECSKQEPSLGNISNESVCEEVVEDVPGHFVCGDDFIYGVYDYDSGKPLPPGAKQVCRYLKGNILIVLKSGCYNKILSATDGRQSDVNIETFRGYIKGLKKEFDDGEKEGKTIDEIANEISRRGNPFRNDMGSKDDILSQPQKRIDYSKEDFSKIISNVTVQDNACLLYYFELSSATLQLEFNDLLDNKRWLLCKDGKVHKLGKDDDNVFMVSKRDDVLKILRLINAQIQDAANSGSNDSCCIHVIRHKKYRPKHLFTEDEIYDVLKSADDRKNNILVIDEQGFPLVLSKSDSENLYPVSYSRWAARRCYTGKYLEHNNYVHEIYKGMLQLWSQYLLTGEEVRGSESLAENKLDDTIKKIQDLYNEMP